MNFSSMEALQKSAEFQERHHLIGAEDQALQVCLFKYDSFITKTQYINYFSPNVETRPIQSNSIRSNDCKRLIEVYNQAASTSYVGLFGPGGSL